MATTNEKINATIQAIIVFIVVSLPATYDLTNGLFDSLFGLKLIESSGCPSMVGLLVHALVFGVIVYILMSID